ncbi:hypothetical protein DFAR_440006 [Desulfarculales bacterium]
MRGPRLADCQTFTGGVIMGRAEKTLCPFIDKSGGTSRGEPAGRVAVTVKDVVEALGLTVAAGAGGLECPVAGGYISDLLSDVIANAKPGAVWLTIQTHQNVVAVAMLKKLAAVILVGGRQPAKETAAKAEQKGIPVLASPEGAFELAGKLHGLGL